MPHDAVCGATPVMCQQCVDAVRRHFPDCPDDEMGGFLFSATCFPFGTAEDVERQLAEAKDVGCPTWEAAIGWADERTRAAMDAAVEPPDGRSAAEPGSGDAGDQQG